MKKLIKILCVSINETFLEGLKNALKSQNLELTFFLLKEDNNDELTKLTSDIDILVLHIHETVDHEFIQKFIKDEFKIMIIGPKILNNINALIKNKINVQSANAIVNLISWKPPASISVTDELLTNRVGLNWLCATA